MSGSFKIGPCLFLGVFVVALTTVTAQKLNWSEPFPWEPDDFRVQYITTVAGGYALLANDPYQSQHYAVAYLKRALGKPRIQNFEAPKNSRFAGIVELGNTLQLFFYQQARDSTYLLNQQYLPGSDSIRPVQEVSAVEGKRYQAYLTSSSDSTVRGLWVNKKGKGWLGFRLDKNLAVVSQKPLKLTDDTLEELKVQAVEAKGHELAILGKDPDKGHLQYIRFDSTFKPHSINLRNDSLAVQTGQLGIDRVNNQFLALGLYKRASGDSYGGLALLQETAGRQYLHYEAFSRDLIKRVFGQNTMKKGLANFKLRTLIPRSDGGAMVFLESYERDKQIYHNRGYFGTINETVRQYHYYEEVVILAVSPSGEVEWSRVHRKKQTTVNDDGRFSSFSHMVLKKQLVFLYNSINNRTMNLLTYTVSPSGEVKGELLLKDRYDQLKPIPRKAEQVGPSSLLLPIFKNKHFHLVTVDFSR